MSGWIAGVAFVCLMAWAAIRITRMAEADEAHRNIVGTIAEQAKEQSDKEISENLNV